MKTLIAVLMSLCLMMTAVAALAGAGDPVTINWRDYEADAANVEGQFATVAGTGLKMFIPAEFVDSEISEENAAGGTIMVLKTEKAEKAVVNAQVVATDLDSLKTLLEEQGRTLWATVLNGIPCLQFTVDTEGVITSCFAFGTEGGHTLVFGFTLANQEPYTSLYKLMVSSIQIAE